MREVNRAAHLHQRPKVPLERVGRAELLPHEIAVLEEGVPRDAGDALEHQHRNAAVVEAEVVDRHDVRVLE